MKKLLLILAVLAMSCNKQNCDEEKAKLTEQYLENLQLSGGNEAAINENTLQYNKKLAEIEKRCD